MIRLNEEIAKDMARITRMRAWSMVALALVAMLATARPARAQDVRVTTSGGFTAAFLELVPEFERMTGTKVGTAFGASMGNAPD